MSTPPSEPKASKMLDLSDALHNFRSAFDAVAWGMAHFNSAAPTRPKSVNFPICSQLTQRDKALKDWVGDIHPQFQERLRIMQPFTYISSAGQVNLLSMLHDLGIHDKHRDILEVSDDFQGIGIDGSIIEYEDRDVLPTAPRVDMRSGVKFVDGVVVGTSYAGASIRSVDGVSLRPAVKVQLAYGIGPTTSCRLSNSSSGRLGATSIFCCLDLLPQTSEMVRVGFHWRRGRPRSGPSGSTTTAGWRRSRRLERAGVSTISKRRE